jgi:DNA modification methylase
MRVPMQESDTHKMQDVNIGNMILPNDFEQCGDCEFDHSYETDKAIQWHNNNPGSYQCQVIRGNCFEVTNQWKSDFIPLIVTDPPYGKILDTKWDLEWTLAKYELLTKIIERILVPGGTAYVWGGIGTPNNRLFLKWISEIEEKSGLQLYDLITWRKKRAYGKSDAYLFTREECAMLVKGNKPKTFNVPLLDEKRGYAGYNADYPAKSEFYRRTNVWTDITELFKGKIHPAEKPSKLAKIMIEVSSNPGELVLDMFAGSGSTGVAASNTGRKSVLIEKSMCEMRIQTG